MKNIFKVSLFTLGLVLSSNAMAATGTGEAQAELTIPLSIETTADIDFATIAIDPSAGPQTVTIDPTNGVRECPASYSCSGTHLFGTIEINAQPMTNVYVSIEGSTATLSDGVGNTMIFDPILDNGGDTWTAWSQPLGWAWIGVGGSINFTGNEPAGTYSSSNAGGSGYQMTVIY